MKNLMSIALISTLLLTAGCGGWRDSRANPTNWFGKSKSRPAPVQQEAGAPNPLIPQERDSIFRRIREQNAEYVGTPVHTVSNLVIERTSTGAIIRATGLPTRLGAYDVRLTSDAKDPDEPVNGVLTYTLKAVQPDDTPQGAARLRQVTAARAISNQSLEGTRVIRVRGLTNVQTTTR